MPSVRIRCGLLSRIRTNCVRPLVLSYIIRGVVLKSVLATVPENAPKVNYRLPGFLSKFLELQVVMWRTNAGLTDRHSYDSRPHQWPGLRRGIVSDSFIMYTLEPGADEKVAG